LLPGLAGLLRAEARGELELASPFDEDGYSKEVYLCHGAPWVEGKGRLERESAVKGWLGKGKGKGKEVAFSPGWHGRGGLADGRGVEETRTRRTTEPHGLGIPFTEWGSGRSRSQGQRRQGWTANRLGLKIWGPIPPHTVGPAFFCPARKG